MMTTEEGYARALVQAAQECGSLEQVRDALGPICESLAQNAVFFSNPVIPAARHVAVLREALEGKADPLTVAFLVMLARRRRLKKLPGIRRHFEHLADALLGRVHVTLRIPFAPDAALLEGLRQNLTARGLIPQDKTEQATLQVIVDKSLIGGFVAEQGGRLLDASVKSRLASLRRVAKGKA